MRFLVLPGAASLALAQAALAKWLLFPLQAWPYSGNRWNEAAYTLVDCGWVTLVLLVPAVLALLPRTPPPPKYCDILEKPSTKGS